MSEDFLILTPSGGENWRSAFGSTLVTGPAIKSTEFV